MDGVVAAGRTAVVFLGLAVVWALADVISWLVPGSYEDADVILPRL